MVFPTHLSLLMMNFLIAQLSNSLSNVLKHEAVIMAAQKANVLTTAQLQTFYLIPKLGKLYYNWIIPKHFIVKDKKIYVSRTIIAITR